MTGPGPLSAPGQPLFDLLPPISPLRDAGLDATAMPDLPAPAPGDDNPLRTDNFATADLRAWERMERVGGPFDTVPRTADVRRVVPRRGRYNIPNVGLFVWRVRAWPVS